MSDLIICPTIKYIHNIIRFLVGQKALQMTKDEKITIRLTPEQGVALDSLVNEGQFKNRSRAVRAALDMLVDDPEEEEENHTSVELPSNILSTLSFLVSIGYFDSLDSAVRQLVRDSFYKLDLTGIKQQFETAEEIDMEASARKMIDDQLSGMIRK